MTGMRSSSDASTSCVATSGFQANPEQCIWGMQAHAQTPRSNATHAHGVRTTQGDSPLKDPSSHKDTRTRPGSEGNETADAPPLTLTLLLWSLTLMMRSFLRRSQTEARPLGLAEARMCCTCRFHATQLMSSRGCSNTHRPHTNGQTIAQGGQ